MGMAALESAATREKLRRGENLQLLDNETRAAHAVVMRGEREIDEQAGIAQFVSWAGANCCWQSETIALVAVDNFKLHIERSAVNKCVRSKVPAEAL